MGKDYGVAYGVKCSHDGELCHRVDYHDGVPCCLFYDVNGRLRFVCKRFVAPEGYVIPKQLSPEDMSNSC